MFFTTLAPLLNAGAKIKIEIAAMNDGEIAFDIHPIPTAGRPLLAKRFTGTAAELDASMAEILTSFTSSNVSVAEQIAAMDVMAKESCKEVSAAATAAPKPRTSKPLKNAAPAGLLDNDEDDEGSAGSPEPLSAPNPPAEKTGADLLGAFTL
ncbi:PRTRC system protein E [Acidovorax soli]|uniref:PRTRC system protein E n=1 Tax=Acidovorax soli TaxID=592050 RepID=A0A1H4DTK4_9BURK|nr:PRTRC system protein E [Acidovorax soli]SEA76113.1 PRTRC system protein E [Acidovorax soli]